ncbi:hypothetical protein PGQ11_002882 [Apiospora arundinis]|uniref:Arrestin-like N-terminal domain-containing protein n=1 Tax=Apiospora arundinis TaxID=335852 RepID=A0ABR2J3H3_9PEZI
MKLGIDTTPNGRGQVFPSSDIVTGAVHLDVHSSLAMSRIEFSIKVLLKSEETEAVGAEYAGHVRYLKVQREKERKEEAGPDDAADCLPSYSPAVTLKATITSDGGGLVYPGDALSLHLRLVVPASAQERLRDCCLSRVRLSLIDPTITNIGHRRVVNLFGTLIREVRMQLPLHQQAPSKCETIELDSALWEDCRIPRPTSTTHEEEERGAREYLLQILCEFSSQQKLDKTFASVLVPVTIAPGTAPPKYELANPRGNNGAIADGGYGAGLYGDP